MNPVPFNTKSTSPDDWCEYCHDRGVSGDNDRPGWRGNREVLPCECDPVLRAKRRLARYEREKQK